MSYFMFLDYTMSSACTDRNIHIEVYEENIEKGDLGQ